MAALLRALWDWFWVSATAVDRVPTAPLSIKLGLFSLFVFVAVLCWVATRAEFGHAGAFCVAVLWPTIIPLLPAMLRAVLVLLLLIAPALLSAGVTASGERLAARFRRWFPPR
jgi:hypothetical protein